MGASKRCVVSRQPIRPAIEGNVVTEPSFIFVLMTMGFELGHPDMIAPILWTEASYLPVHSSDCPA